MRPRSLTISVIVLALVAGGYVWLRDRPNELRAHNQAQSYPEPTATNFARPDFQSAVAPTNIPNLDTSPKAADDPLSDKALATRLAAAKDYAKFAQSLLGPANAGHAGAQYYLYEALRFCDDGYRAYFDRGGKRRTVDEALRWASTRTGGVSMDDVRSVYEKCHALKDQSGAEFGTASVWLENAAKAKHPLAEATTGSELLGLAHLVALGGQTPAGSVVSLGGRSTAEKQAEGVALLREALESKHPGVLWKMGEVQGLLQQDMKEAMKSQFAWWLVACERGLECGADSPWLRQACYLDPRHLCRQGEGIREFMQREMQNDVLEIEQLAKDISTSLDAGAYGDLLPTKDKSPTS